MLSGQLSKADLHLLLVFVTVAQQKGFSAAQVVLNVSTSTISRQISDLEARLGMRLCQRGRSGFQLTDKGEITYLAAQQLFQSLDKFTETVNGSQGPLVGHLSLGVIDNWVANETAPIVSALSRFITAAPQVTIELHSMAPDDIEAGVLDGKIAVGVGVFQIHKPGLRYTEIGREFIGLYAGTGHPLFHATRPEVQEDLLAQATMAKRAYLKETQFAPMPRGKGSNVTAHQVEGIALLILTGKFIGYLPHSFAAQWLKSGRMKSVMDGRYDLPTSIEIVTRRSSALTPACNTFIRHLKADTNA